MVRGVEATAEQLASQQVAVLLVAAGISSGRDAGPGYRIGSHPIQDFVHDGPVLRSSTPVVICETP